MRALSRDLRTRIHQARLDGQTTDQVAQRFGVSPALVRRLEQRYRETGLLEPRKGKPGRRPLLDEADGERLLPAVRDLPDDTAEELRDQLGLDVSVLTVWRALRRLGHTFKKMRARAAEPQRPDGQERPAAGSAERGDVVRGIAGGTGVVQPRGVPE